MEKIDNEENQSKAEDKTEKETKDTATDVEENNAPLATSTSKHDKDTAEKNDIPLNEAENKEGNKSQDTTSNNTLKDDSKNENPVNEEEDVETMSCIATSDGKCEEDTENGNADELLGVNSDISSSISCTSSSSVCTPSDSAQNLDPTNSNEDTHSSCSPLPNDLEENHVTDSTNDVDDHVTETTNDLAGNGVTETANDLEGNHVTSDVREDIVTEPPAADDAKEKAENVDVNAQDESNIQTEIPPKMLQTDCQEEELNEKQDEQISNDADTTTASTCASNLSTDTEHQASNTIENEAGNVVELIASEHEGGSNEMPKSQLHELDSKKVSTDSTDLTVSNDVQNNSSKAAEVGTGTSNSYKLGRNEILIGASTNSSDKTLGNKPHLDQYSTQDVSNHGNTDSSSSTLAGTTLAPSEKHSAQNQRSPTAMKLPSDEHQPMQTKVKGQVDKVREDIYDAQIKQLEVTIAGLQKDLKQSQEKLVTQDGAAKRYINYLQGQMKEKIEALTKKKKVPTESLR